jgi:DNA-binding response OmpR family regulator
MNERQSGEAEGRRTAQTILAVDRNRASLHALAHRLGQRGHLTVLADHGAEALGLIAARGYDLLLLDTAMPSLSALHVLRTLRTAHDTVDLPIILTFAPNDSDAALAGFAAGADDCVVSTYDPMLLAARIERALAQAARIADLKRRNLALDARVAARAIELGEIRTELAAARTEWQRLQRQSGS